MGKVRPLTCGASGIATITSGNSSVIVTHGLDRIPDISSIHLSPTHSEVASAWITGITSTQFTINVSAAVTADRDIGWSIIIV